MQRSSLPAELHTTDKVFGSKLDFNHAGYVRVFLAWVLLRSTWLYVDRNIFAETVVCVFLRLINFTSYGDCFVKSKYNPSVDFALNIQISPLRIG